MTIAYATKAKAEKAGVILSEDSKELIKAWGGPNFPPGTVLAHHPKHNLRAFGVGGPAAFEQIAALMHIKSVDDSRTIVPNPEDPFMVAVFNHNRSKTAFRGWAVPTDALVEIRKLDEANKAWLGTKVPDDGGEAYKQGFTAGDNPHDEPGEDEDREEITPWDAWNEAWDEAADAEQEAEEDVGGSVVKHVFRERYKEAGHPNHCGDWLAETLNNLVLGKTATDIANFEAVCEANGVSLAKYNHTTPGWQGRIRMTGRNLLASVVFSTGKLVVPKGVGDGPTEFKAPAEWISAQNFKTKKQVAVLEAGRATIADQMAKIKKSKGKK